MSRAYDFSWTHPSASDLTEVGADGVLCYDLVSTPSPEQIGMYLAAGLHVCYIHEREGTEARDGYQRGRDEAAVANKRVPNDIFLYVNAWDHPNTPTNMLDSVSAYFRGFGEVYRDPFGAYGNFDALIAASLGTDRLHKLWGVETWIAGAKGSGQQGHVEHNANLWRPYADIVQLVGETPLEGTDANEIIQPDWYSLETVIITPPKRRRSTMLMYYLFNADLWCDVYFGGVQIDSFRNEGPYNGYGVGAEMQRYLDKGCGGPQVLVGADLDEYTRPGGLRDKLLGKVPA